MTTQMTSDNYSAVVAQAWQSYKSQNYQDAFLMVKDALAQGDALAYYAMQCQWVVYRYVKTYCSQVTLADFELCARFYVNCVDKKPDLARSLFLNVALEVSKRLPDFDFVSFCVDFDLQALRPDDYLGHDFTTDDGRQLHYDSLAERVACRLYNRMKAATGHDRATVEALLPFFQGVKCNCSGNKFVDMYIGLLYSWMGDTDKALDVFKQILCTAPEWYIWKNMMLLTTDPDLKVALCCKASSMVFDEKYKGALHLQLASSLKDTDAPHAAMEIGKYVETYRQNGWRISGDVYMLQSQLSGVTPATDAAAFYRANAKKAEEVVYAHVKPVVMKYVKLLTMPGGKNRALLVAANSKVKVPVGKLGKGAQVGSLWSVRLNGHTVLTLEPAQPGAQYAAPAGKPTVDIKGTVHTVRNHGFCFVGDKYFVPESLTAQHSLIDGVVVTGQAIAMPDGRWRVVKIQSVC